MFLPHVKSSEFYNLKLSASCQASSPLNHTPEIRQDLSCFIIWIIRRDVIGFGRDTYYISVTVLPKCAHAFRRSSAHCCQKNETFCWRGGASLCAVLGAQQKMTSVKPTKPLNGLWRYCNYIFLHVFACVKAKVYLIVEQDLSILCLQKKTVPWVSDSKYKLSDFTRPVIYSQTW